MATEICWSRSELYSLTFQLVDSRIRSSTQKLVDSSCEEDIDVRAQNYFLSSRFISLFLAFLVIQMFV